MECCGHLSCFEHAGLTFATDLEGAEEWADDPRSTDSRILDAVGVGSRFSYEYDFGTTTELVGRALALVPGASTDDPIAVLARNEPPVRTCANCGQSATTVCGLCYSAMDAPCWYCDSCSRHHACTESGYDSFLPVVNSPRVGLCAYGGPAEG